MAKGFPVVLLSNKFSRFLDVKVACQQVVIVLNNQLSSNDFRNVGQALMMQDSIGILPVLAQFFCFDFLCLIIFCFQLYQLQSHASNTSLVEVFCSQVLTERFVEIQQVGEGVRPAEYNMFQECYIAGKSTRRIGFVQQKLQTLKNFCIFSLKNFFLALTLLRVARQSINSLISHFVAMIDSKMVARQLFGPAGLAGAKILCIHEPM